MTPAELDAIEARANAATPGPWEHTFLNGVALVYIAVQGPDGAPESAHVASVGSFTDPRWQANAAIIAACRTDVPALVAEVRRLQSEVLKLRKVAFAASVVCDESANASRALVALHDALEEEP